MLTGLGGLAVMVLFLSSKSLTFGVIIVVADELCLLKPSGKKNLESNLEKTTLHFNASIINLSIQRIILIGTKGPIPTLGPKIKSHFVLYQTALHCHETFEQ